MPARVEPRTFTAIGTDLDCFTAFEAYNTTALRAGLPQAAKLTPDRKRRIAARLRDYGLDGWMLALANLEKSAFLTGSNDRGFRADLEFVCQPKSFNKLHDGAYGNRTGPPYSGPHMTNFDRNIEGARRFQEMADAIAARKLT